MSDQYSGLLSPFLRRQRMAKARPLIAGRVLDIGCATGTLAESIEPARYVGVDIDEGALEQARANHPQHRFIEPAELGDDETFQTVVALAVIEHVEDPVGWCEWVRAHLDDIGHVIIPTPHRRWEFIHGLAARVRLASHEAHEEHHETFDRKSITALLESTDFRVRTYRRFLLGLNQLIVAEPRA
jgi:2-polyprenyl-3-methyl-5-hydroxy-6-metoxy-1,4-benzoquinol methylase